MAIEFTLHHDSPSITNRDGHLRRPLEIVLISRVLGSMDSHIKGRYSMGTWDSCIAQALLGAGMNRKGHQKSTENDGKMMEHQHKTRGFGGIINDGTWWYTMGVWGKLILLYFKKRSDKVNLLIRCLMSPCFKIIQVAVCGPWCPLRWPQPLRICYPSKSTLNLERWLWNALDHHFQIARKCTFLGLHVRHVRCFWVYSNILALSLSHDSIHAQKRSLPRLPHSSNLMSSISAPFCFESWVCTPWCSTCTKLRCWADDLQPNPPDKSVTWLAKMQTNPVV